MRKWTFELVIKEGNDEFWEGYGACIEDSEGKAPGPRGFATCEEVENLVRCALDAYTMDGVAGDYELTIRKMENLRDNIY